MHLEIVSPENVLFSGEVQSVTFPGADGQFQVLNNHAPLVGVLDKGTVKILNNEGKTEFIEINPGFVEVLQNKVTVMV